MIEETQGEFQLFIEKRDGEVVEFDQEKVGKAIANAAAAAGKMHQEFEASIRQMVLEIEAEIRERFTDFVPNVENIHDVVEKTLMKQNCFEVAKAYILYRANKHKSHDKKKFRKFTVVKSNGSRAVFNIRKIKKTLEKLKGTLEYIEIPQIIEEVTKILYDGIKTEEITKSLVMATTSFIENDPEYSVLAARIFLGGMSKEVYNSDADDEEGYRKSFVDSIRLGIEEGIVDSRLGSFNLERLSKVLVLDRDDLFKYIGIQTLYERYFTKHNGRLLEMPQAFWMRVAMGLSVLEDNPEDRAIEFYEVMSKMDYTPSTPTLFHSGLANPQLSSCYLTTVEDDLKYIFKSLEDNAQLSKWSGGLGNDWTPIRGTGSFIKTTKVDSQGVVPFLKIANDVTVAINRSGKRRGATCAYLETWHLDIEDFLDLRKNTGDERRRTADMNTANWIPDLFFKRFLANGTWTLFSPEEAPDLHDLYGEAFDTAYLQYEEMAKAGKIRKFKVIEAGKLWKKMVGMLFETGHPWITFKDACNIRSPQDHVGVVHSSNLCTEITLNTKTTKNGELGEIAVCNLGSINLPRHMDGDKLDWPKLKRTVNIAMRMLDNVVDINFYPVEEARNANLKHRPVGLGVMGLQDALFIAGIDFEHSHEFVDECQEFIAYHAIAASSALAVERGSYSTFEGSKWQRGIFPLDTLDLLEESRGYIIDVPRTQRLDWDALKETVKKNGMRNSNTMAIAPTATISNITSCYPCTEAAFKNIYVKSNMSGEFTVVNEYLVNDLKKLGKWNQDTLDRLKYYDGSIQPFDDLPNDLKARYKEIFEIDQKVAIDLTALRSKWIDQSQSHNVFYKGKSGQALSEIYLHAWRKGLKTTYYLRTLAASQVEKSTLDAAKFGFTQVRPQVTMKPEPEPVKLCKINDPDCEACQ